MQKRCAPAASAARACSSICSGSIIACIGVSASAKRDWAQKPQSSAQPPDFALTSEHMSVESPKRSTRASQARSISASISPWSLHSPNSSASSRVINGGIADSAPYSSTTSVSPSWTACPSSQRISVTVPASSASTGISIFIDSSTTTVSPSAT